MTEDTLGEFGRFRLRRKLGEGGMAEIFLADAPIPGGGSETCVIKVMRQFLSSQPQFVDMFLTEADICTFLSHPNLVEVFEAGEIDGRYYMAMEFADGLEMSVLLETLQQRQIECPIPLCVFVGMALARALDYLHRATTLTGRKLDLVHRDVNATNVYLLRNGQVKLGDLGVASVSFLEEGRDGGVSDAPIKGKLRYLAPELLLRKPLTPKLDLYCLGVTLWEMVTLQRAFLEPSDEMTMMAIVEKGLPNPRKWRSDCPRALRRIIAKAAHRDPEKRYADAGQMFRELRSFADKEGHSYDQGKLAIFVEYVEELRRQGPSDLDGAPTRSGAVAMVRQWLGLR